MKTSEIMQKSLAILRPRRRAFLGLIALSVLAAPSRSQDGDRGWLERDPIWNNYDLTIGNEQWLQQVEPEGRGGRSRGDDGATGPEFANPTHGLRLHVDGVVCGGGGLALSAAKRGHAPQLTPLRRKNHRAKTSMNEGNGDCRKPSNSRATAYPASPGANAAKSDITAPTKT